MSRPPSIIASRQASPVRSERSLSSARPSPTSPTFPQMPNIDSLTMMGSSPKLASRPGRGTLGKKGKALINYFHLDITQMKDIVSYASEHKENGSDVRLRIAQRSDGLLLENHVRYRSAASNYGNRFYSVSGKDLIKPGELSYSYVVDYYEPEEPGPRPGGRRLLVSVTLRQDGQFAVAPFLTYVNNPDNLSFPRLPEYISMTNTLIDRVVSQNNNLVTFARRTRFFDLVSVGGKKDLGGGLDAYPGYFKSVRDCEAGLFLNMNTSACAMFKTGRLDVVMDKLTAVRPELRGATMKGCRVQTNYSGSVRIRTVMGLAPSTKPGLPTDDNVEIQCPQHGRETVQKHFQRAWPNLQRPNPRALVIDFGNQVYIPSDLATIKTPQPFRGALSSDQTANMITFACRKPGVNKGMIINTGMPYLGFNTPGGSRELFGIGLFTKQPEMMRVNVRLLPSPSLCFGGKNETNLSSGAWNMKQKKFILPSTADMVRLSYIDVKRPGGRPSQNIADFVRGINDGLRYYIGSRSGVRQFPDFQHVQELDKDEDPARLAHHLHQEFKKLRRTVSS